jgi:hypothetical protein
VHIQELDAEAGFVFVLFVERDLDQAVDSRWKSTSPLTTFRVTISMSFTC